MGEHKDDEYKVRFLKEFLSGRWLRRQQVRLAFSYEVSQLANYRIPVERKMNELLMAVAEELPEGAIELTTGLYDKGDEMRLIYTLFGYKVPNRLKKKTATSKAAV